MKAHGSGALRAPVACMRAEGDRVGFGAAMAATEAFEHKAFVSGPSSKRSMSVHLGWLRSMKGGERGG